MTAMRRMIALAGALALSACAAALPQQVITTPEGAVIDADPDLAYEPGQLTPAQLSASTRDVFAADFMNVFRRFDPARTQDMVRFYTGALGLKSLSPIQLTSTQQMILTGIGSAQVKLAAGLPEGRRYALGGVNGGTGIRYFRIAYPDEAEVTANFARNGFAAPQFARWDGLRAAIVMDPGGFPVEIVIDPAASSAGGSRVGVGIAASDLAASRAFYRTFVGLDELPPVTDPAIGQTLYPFRNGETTILLFQAAAGAPVDDGSAGIQYIVGDAAMVDARAKHRQIPVQTPLNRLSGFDLTTIWLSDPDGVTNYFAQVGPRR